MENATAQTHKTSHARNAVALWLPDPPNRITGLLPDKSQLYHKVTGPTNFGFSASNGRAFGTGTRSMYFTGALTPLANHAHRRG